MAGFGIGAVAAIMGVAGGELLIPMIVLLFGEDIKTAGSLSLLVPRGWCRFGCQETGRQYITA
ncbi:hypothetical protein OG851_39800 [Streptomyces sp. NBC_00161]|uniref:hypothetical protein n=1 Tax=Streptomyces sp. NBC_00161 TaxID=2975671 RepID=UPI003247B91F